MRADGSFRILHNALDRREPQLNISKQVEERESVDGELIQPDKCAASAGTSGLQAQSELTPWIDGRTDDEFLSQHNELMANKR